MHTEGLPVLYNLLSFDDPGEVVGNIGKTKINTTQSLLRFVFTVSKSSKSILIFTTFVFSSFLGIIQDCKTLKTGDAVMKCFFLFSFHIELVKIQWLPQRKIQRQMPSLLCMKVCRERAVREKGGKSLSAKFNRLV